MEALEFAVAILSAVLALTWLARGTGLSEPAVLLLGGIALGFVPGLRDVALPPDVVLFLFLPALLYWETLNTSLRQIRANLRVIVLLSIGLVIATAVAVAAAAHALGLPWPAAFVLGAVLAPTDATAVAAVGDGLPRRALTILRAESLVNDGTALVIFAVAVGVAVDGQAFELGPVSVDFAVSYLGGAAAGVLVAFVVRFLRTRTDEPLLHNTISVLTPLVAYLAAELVHGSGVIAVVVCGLILAHFGPLVIPAQTRVQASNFWELTTFLLNGALFVLVGLQIPQAVRALSRTPSVGLPEALVYGIAATLAVVGARIAWFYTTPYLLRAVDRRPRQRLLRVGARGRFPSAWAGVRGGVSLAAALAIPAAAPARELIIVTTAFVILATVLVQGQTLPAVIRWARLPPDAAEHDEERVANRAISQAALEALPAEAQRLGAPAEVTDEVADEMRTHLADLEIVDRVDDDEHRVRHADVQLRLALLPHKRRALVDLRDAGRIDDSVLLRVQRVIDAEEIRLHMRRHFGETEAEQRTADAMVSAAGPSAAPDASPSP